MELVNKILNKIGAIVSSRLALCAYIVILILSLFTLNANAKTVYPRTVAQMRETSVRIVDAKMKSGGTGSILQSTAKATYILTNKHVCRLVEQGGNVYYHDVMNSVTHYKKFPDHDLCLVRIEGNLNINLTVSRDPAQISDSITVSGHPNLLPHIATQGHLSEVQEIELLAGVTPCTGKEGENPLFCLFLGGMPVIKKLEAQLMSNLIMPGSSGSAVFNKHGQLVGVVFAGQGDGLSYGYMVPQLPLLYFTQNVNHFEWVPVGTPVDDKGVQGRVFDYTKCKRINRSDKVLKDFCNKTLNPLIWRE